MITLTCIWDPEELGYKEIYLSCLRISLASMKLTIRYISHLYGKIPSLVVLYC